MTNHYFRLVRSGCRYLLNWPCIFCFIVLLSINAKAQNTQYTFTQAPLNTVISQISAKTKYEFVYDAALVKKAKPINFTLNTADIKTIMDAVVKGQDFNYEISNNRTIILKIPKEDNADEYVLHGMVTDSLGSPLPGASVKIKNTNKYILTDGNGHFNLNLSDQYNTLEISYIGYLSATQRFDRNATLKVVTVRLSANASLLAEVVVNGFQTLPLERNAGAFSTVDQKKLNEQINPSILAALEGRVAGLAYDKNPYGIGADKQVIRGRGTFSINTTGVRTDPLIVIDGLPSETALEDVNPYDIESVTVLKDAAASSIYGSRSANGVIIFSGGNVIRRDVTNISAYDVTDENITQRFKNGNVPDVPRILVDYPEALINSASTINSMWQAADINVVKGDYIKLRNISLSYNLPKGMIGKFKLPSAKFTAQVSNLWYASAAGDDIDPESYSGITGTRTLENPKSFVFGLNLTF